MLSLPVCALRSITTMQDLKMGEFDAQLEYVVLGLLASHSAPAKTSVTFQGNLSGNVTLFTCAHCTSSMPEASTNEPRYSPTFAQRHYYDFRFARCWLAQDVAPFACSGAQLPPPLLNGQTR
jgi:hypothetical protein